MKAAGRNDRLYDGITDIRDDLIDQAQKTFRSDTRKFNQDSRENVRENLSQDSRESVQENLSQDSRESVRENFSQDSVESVHEMLDRDSVEFGLEMRSSRKKNINFPWKKWSCAAAAVIFAAVMCVFFLPDRDSSTNISAVSAHVVAKASYPKAASYPNEADYMKNGELDYDNYMEAYDAWFEEDRKRNELKGYADGMDGFLLKSTKQFLSDSESKNRIYSPLNVYMALGMLAELTAGDSRQQILGLLGAENLEMLRKQASDLWNANYRNDGAVTNILASSLWLNQDVRFEQGAMNTLAETYYASSYQGKMGSKQLNQLLQNWLDEQTGGLLKEQAQAVELSPETILALATTVYFRAKWYAEFSKDFTKEGKFHAKQGDLDCDFMNKEQCSMDYYWGEKFSAVSQSLDRYGSMWFLLPDEEVSVDELLNDKQAMDFLLSDKQRSDWENKKFLEVNLSIPVFDASSEIELQDGLKELGVTDVFDPALSDFSAMTKEQDGICLSKADHAVRVSVDEEGVAAAAYTVMAMDGSGFIDPEEEIDFVLDRPFLFVIAGSDGMPEFVGVINDPKEVQ